MPRFFHLVLFALLLLPAVDTSVSAQELPREIDFSRHIVPTLYRLGCSAGACHGAFAGKGGFRLSLFASRPDIDGLNLRGTMNRRIDPLHPERSLLLRKPTEDHMGHGGGRRFDIGSPEYRLLHRWIAEGARTDSRHQHRLASVRVEPATVTASPGETSLPEVKVLATLADGTTEDVTWFTTFESRDPSIATITPAGEVQPGHVGDIPVLAHYAGEVAFVTVEVPAAPASDIAPPQVPLNDPVDQLIAARLDRLNIVPSGLCTDEEFLRRAYLDTLSILPTPDQVREFLADNRPDKRARLIDQLLEHPLHNALWATRLTDMLGADNRFLDPVPFHDWFRNKLEQNLGWDEIARGVVLGSAADERSIEDIAADLERQAAHRRWLNELKKQGRKPPVEAPTPVPWRQGYGTRRTMDALYTSNKYQQQIRDENNKTLKTILNSQQVALQLSHALLGVQLTCAQCHKHPYDRWTEADFYGFATVFTYLHKGIDPLLAEKQVRLNGLHTTTEQAETFPDPLTGETLLARTLGGVPITIEAGVDPRRAVADWLTDPANPYFARAMVNRVWAHYMGRGLYEPVDSQSAANPPSHPRVLDELVRDFISHDYNLRHLHRRILNLVAYQRSWRTNRTSVADERNYSHYQLQRMTAEQVVDSLCTITGTSLALKKVYYTKAERPGQRLIESALSRFRGDDWHALLIFGKPRRVQACDCERGTDPSLSQAMYLYNDESLWNKIADEHGRLAQLVNETSEDRQLLEELYLWTLTRRPTAGEISTSLEFLQSADSRLAGYQDILWSLFNRQEFIVRH